MTWLFVIAGVSLLVGCVIGWESAYRLGVKHGRMLQSTDDRNEVERAVLAVASAEQLAETWARRARALLHAHFGPEHKP